jgi:hypothetical protein
MFLAYESTEDLQFYASCWGNNESCDLHYCRRYH